MMGSPTNRSHPLAHVASWLLGVSLLFAIAGLAQGADVIRCKLADGFDFPVGKPDAYGYYKSRGFYPHGHMGEDWNGRGGGNSDLGAPIYSIGRGVVVFSENIGTGWGNCIIIRHAFRDASGKVSMIDSQYGHLLQRQVKLHQIVEKGQQIGTMGSNNGMYLVHLHFEIRKNLKIGMNRSQFAQDYSNYHSPTHFINAHRTLNTSFRRYEIPVKTFAAYGKSLSSIRTTNGSGLNIPVFERSDGGGDDGGSSEGGDGDFWSRLKNKITGGSVTQGTEEP